MTIISIHCHYFWGANLNNVSLDADPTVMHSHKQQVLSTSTRSLQTCEQLHAHVCAQENSLDSALSD